MVLAVKNPPAKAGDRRRGFDPWVGKIPPPQSGLAQKDQEIVGRDAVCIQNLLPTSSQFQGLLPVWLWEVGKREGPFELNGSMSAAGRFPWSCSGWADYWGWSTDGVCVYGFPMRGMVSPWCSPLWVGYHLLRPGGPLSSNDF